MQPEATVSPLVNLFPAIFLFAIMYLLLIRPQQKRQKQHQSMVAGLQKNDNVVTSGGIHGTIANVKEHTIVLKVDDHLKFEVDRGAVARVLKKGN